MRVALLLFRALMQLLPQSYSQRQRADALALTQRLTHEANVQAGRVAAARVMLGALLDLTGQIVYSRFRPAIARAVLQGLSRDIHHAFRVMGAKRAYSAAVIGVLALGIGLNAAVFSVADWVLLRPLPYPFADALVRVWASDKASLGTPGDLAYSEVDALAKASSFRASAGLSTITRVISAPGLEPAHVNVVRVTGDLFSTLGIYPALGRGFDAHEADLGGRVVVVSDALWRNRFAADVGIIGAVITLDDLPHTVVGVMPPHRRYPPNADLWRPSRSNERVDDDRENVMIARLADGIGESEAMAEVSALRPESGASPSGRVVWLESLHASEVRGVRAVLAWLLGAAALVLVVACANVAALMATRGLDRAGELAIRGALGAGRLQLARQLLVEGLVLGTAGGALGIIVGAIALDAIVGVAPAGLPRLDEIKLDARIIGVCAVAMLAAGTAVSLPPAWRATRTDLTATMNTVALPRTFGRFGPRRFLVATQVAAAVVLTIAAALLTRSLRAAIAVDHGFEAGNVITLNLNLRGMDPAQVVPLFSRLVDAAHSLTAVQSAAVSFRLPTELTGLRLPLRLRGADQPASAVALRLVTPRYFETVGIPLLAGRSITAADSRDRPRVGIVNRAFVRELLAGASPIGKQVAGELLETGVDIVGVVGDVTPAGQADRPALYMSYQQFSINAGTLLVKSRGKPSTLLPELRTRIRAVAPALPLDRVETLDESLAAGRAVARFNTLLAASFGAVAALLSMIGVYALTSREVASRRRESGLRAALGADRRALLWDLTRRVGTLTVFGIIVGTAAAAGATQAMRALLHGVTPLDPATFVTVPLSFVLIAAASVVAAARPILQADPATILRN